MVVIFAEGGLIFSLTSSFVPLRSSMRAVCSSTGLSGQQPAHRPLLWVQYHGAAAVLLDLWPFPAAVG